MTVPARAARATPKRNAAAARRRATAPAVTATELLRLLLESLRDAVVLVGRDGRIVLVNEETERLFGYRREQLIGQTVEMLVPERLWSSHAAHRDRFFGDPRPRLGCAGVALYGRRSDGSEFPADIALSSIETPEGVLATATIRDDTQRRLAAAIYATDDAIIGKSLDGTITSWNPGAQKLYGYSEAEARGQPSSMLVPEGCADDVAEMLLQLSRGEQIDRHEMVRVCKDGTLIDVSLMIMAVRDVHGLVVGGCTIAREITDRTRLEAELVASRDEARKASQSKSEFVASMSHELRTPLNGVIGLTGLLAETPLDPLQHKYVDGLRRSADVLLAVINDVLDLSKIEAGQLELDRTDFDLRAAAGDAIQIVAELAHAKSLEINYWVDDDVAHTVNGDSGRLAQVLLNLLANAVKFTASGEVTLRVTNDGADRLRFSVADTGIGINPAQAARLFERFVQADQSTTRNYGGTGLGLAISRRLVELMAGEIGAGPRPGGGSVFWFTAAMPAVVGAASERLSKPDLQSRRTLIVDDNATNRMILEHQLRGWGLACESLDRPTAALVALEQASQEGQPFELAVLDFNLPQMDGVELLKEIRRRPGLRTLRMLIISAGAVDTDLLETIGGCVTLTKPVSPDALHRAILDAFAGAKPALRRAEPAVRARLDRGLRVLLVEDNDINTTVAEGLLIAMGVQPELSETGREAVEMAASKAYDMIFMDCQMPDVDGFEATHQIREAESGHRVPIVAMTAYALAGDRDRCIEAGMDDYISKPVRREDVEAVFGRWLPTRAPRRRGPSAASDVPLTAARAGGIFDQARIGEIRATLTAAKRRRLAAAFAKQTTAYVAAIATAVRSADHDEVKRLTHQLRGTSVSVGAITLAACCEKLAKRSATKTLAADASQLRALRAAAKRAIAALGQQLKV